ncbi:MAG: DUF3307 domain-containing protein [Chlamydiae bacterium]|nr:DUF3307 domain-containing protein [Chlamydiota bacterium]MBI3267072.1 DUF3307 domain-containing protein [Chlamydiota bacterium]
MFLFLRLLLAHFIGDFPLQIGVVYSAKVKSVQGKILHAGLVTLSMIVFTWPYWKNWIYWGLILFLGTLHFFQDWGKLAIAQRIKNSNNFFLYMADQVLHVASFFMIWLTPLPQIPMRASHSFFISGLYFNDKVTIFLIAVLAVSFAGTFTLATFKATFLSERFYTPYLDPLEKNYGILERGVMLEFLILSPKLIWLFPLFLLSKFFYANHQIKKIEGNPFTPFLLDTVLGMILTTLIYKIYTLFS